MTPYYQDDAVTIYHGDCRDILPHLGPVDLVLNNSAKNSTVSNHEALSNGEKMAGEESRDRMALLQSELVTGTDGLLLQHFTNGHDESAEAARCQIPWARQDGKAEWTVQRRYSEHLLSCDDSKRQVREVRSRREVSYSSQERESPRQPLREPSSSLSNLPQQPTQKVVVGNAEILICTDPPYGINYDASHSKYKNGIDRGAATWDTGPFDPACILALRLPTILWGGNCFASRLPDNPGWLCWLKTARNEADIRQADMELAWTNFIRRPQTFRHLWIGAYRDSESGLQNMHPTQKPLA